MDYSLLPAAEDDRTPTRFSLAITQHLMRVLQAIDYGETPSHQDVDVLRSLVTNAAPPDIKRVLAQGNWTGALPGQGHFLWSGPTDRKTGIPIMHRWNGQKDVPVYKIIWSICRSDELVGRPRKLESCDSRVCASPLCYRIIVPMHVDGRPENSHNKRYRRENGLARRPIWHFEDMELRAGILTPVCHQCRQPTGFSSQDAALHVGKQVYCRFCEADDDDIRTSAGLRRPEPAYRWAPKVNPYVERALISEEEAQRIEARNAHDDEILAQLEREADELMDEEEEAYGPGQ